MANSRAVEGQAVRKSKKPRTGQGQIVQAMPSRMVEVSTNNTRYTGGWYEARVYHRMARSKKVSVEYVELIDGKDPIKQFRETVDIALVRPRPPIELNQTFQVGDTVEACKYGGWWTAHITEDFENMMFVVKVPGLGEEWLAMRWEVRCRRKWVDGRWVRA